MKSTLLCAKTYFVSAQLDKDDFVANQGRNVPKKMRAATLDTYCALMSTKCVIHIGASGQWKKTIEALRKSFISSMGFFSCMHNYWDTKKISPWMLIH